MTSILLLLTAVAVAWLCLWVANETSPGRGVWSPFEMRDGGDVDTRDPPPRDSLRRTPGPSSLDTGAPSRRLGRLRPLVRPTTRPSSERPWKQSVS